jgi:protein-L-isoaspartate(D-aspartate) O-methyltransferase
MLAPRVEARLLQELSIRKTDKVLEVGTGSGYMAALLAARAEHVVSIEVRPTLAETARQNLQQAGIHNVNVECGDGIRGWSQRAPFDVIILSGSVPEVPPAILKQLRVGGRLAAIVGRAPVMEAQLITCEAEGVFNTVNLFETVIPALDGTAISQEFTL